MLKFLVCYVFLGNFDRVDQYADSFIQIQGYRQHKYNANILQNTLDCFCSLSTFAYTFVVDITHSAHHCT